MLSELKLLIIDDDQDRAHDVSVIMNFIGEDCMKVKSTQWRELFEEKEIFLGIAIGSHHSYSTTSQLVEEIHQLSPTIPVLLMGDLKFSGELSESHQMQIVGRIDLPAKYNQLLEVLHACQECHDNQHSLSDGQKPLELFRSLVGTSTAVSNVRRLIEQVSKSDATVLILGESGTGKEVAARNIHYLSDRSEKPFVPVNCGAIPAELLESELFGHEKGAFTGALSARQGRFELAQGGTLFLDEIGDMPLAMQVKILRVLQEKSFERVGSNKTINADVRIIAATHRELEHEVKEGGFREDLFYRLNVFPIEMPPLREREEDISLLANELIIRLEKQGRDSVRLSDNAMSSLMRHSWPGNVRELANLIERLCILYPYGVVDINELPEKYQYRDGLEAFPTPELKATIKRKEKEKPVAEIPPIDVRFNLPDSGLNLKEFIANLEVDYIKKALEETHGVVAQAAEMLGMRRTTLVEKMKKYHVQRDDQATEN